MFPEREARVNVLVERLWGVILLEEPETNPWEFACKVARMGYLAEADLWDAAEWADGIRENARRLRQVGDDDQAAARAA
jgi:hypothetical protein